VDDRPFGGGPGMLLKPEPIFEAVESLARENTRVILLSPAGRMFNQAIAAELAQAPELLLVSGHYEGFDDRVREHLADDELSIGDYVLTNGALPVMVIVDAVTRLLPGVLVTMKARRKNRSAMGCSNIRSTPGGGIPRDESPEVLLSGNHGEIARWRAEQARLRTKERRPDLL